MSRFKTNFITSPQLSPKADEQGRQKLQAVPDFASWSMNLVQPVFWSVLILDEINFFYVASGDQQKHLVTQKLWYPTSALNVLKEHGHIHLSPVLHFQTIQPNRRWQTAYLFQTTKCTGITLQGCFHFLHMNCYTCKEINNDRCRLKKY